jgi:hypothetical protein
MPLPNWPKTLGSQGKPARIMPSAETASGKCGLRRNHPDHSDAEAVNLGYPQALIQVRFADWTEYVLILVMTLVAIAFGVLVLCTWV